jgi:hypothetical protein
MHGCPIEGTVVVPPATYREITLLGEFDCERHAPWYGIENANIAIFFDVP